MKSTDANPCNMTRVLSFFIERHVKEKASHKASSGKGCQVVAVSVDGKQWGRAVLLEGRCYWEGGAIGRAVLLR